jgi:hypothetical protein
MTAPPTSPPDACSDVTGNRNPMSRRQWVVLALFVVLCMVPFLHRSPSWDDTVFWSYADRLTANPAVCVVADMVFLGRILPNLVIFESTHPPLIPYWIKTLRHVFGDALPPLHLGFMLFPVTAGLALAWWTRRVTPQSPWLAMVAVVGPLTLPSATGFMADVPLLALWFLAMALWASALDGPSGFGWRHVATAVATAAACFTAYQGLGLLAILALQGGLRRRWAETAAVTMASILPFTAWLLMVWRNYGIVPYFVSLQDEVNIAGEVHKGLDPATMATKSVALTVYLGAGLLLPLVVLALRPAWRRPAIVAMVVGAIASPVVISGSGWLQLAWGGLLLAGGILAILFVGRVTIEAAAGTGVDRSADLPLLASVAWFGAFLVLPAPFAAPRYVLVLLAALLLLLARRLPPLGRSGTTLIVGATTLLGLLVGGAEQEYAWAQRLDRLDLPVAATHFVGEGGARFSGERIGYVSFLPQVDPAVAHLLVPRETDHVAVPRELLVQAEVVKRIVIPGRIPIRVMNRDAGAGLYIHTRGLLPFSWSTEPLEEFTLYDIADRRYQACLDTWRQEPHHGAPAGEILPGAAVVQDFTCSRDGLSVIDLHFATYARPAAGTLVVSLAELTPSGPRTVFSRTLSAGDVEDNQWRSFPFPGLRSEGRSYRLTLSSPDATPGSALTVWTDRTAPTSFRRGTDVVPGSLCLDAYCEVVSAGRTTTPIDQSHEDIANGR